MGNERKRNAKTGYDIAKRSRVDFETWEADRGSERPRWTAVAASDCMQGVDCALSLCRSGEGGVDRSGRIAQSIERSANNAVVLGSSPSMTKSFVFASPTRYLIFGVCCLQCHSMLLVIDGAQSATSHQTNTR